MPRLAATCALVAAAGALLLAQSTGQNSQTQDQLPQFRAGVDLIRLDVSVLDRQRQPVRGLHARDFTVIENGQVQPIAAFSEVDVPDPDDPPALWMRDVQPDIRRNDNLEDRRLVIIVLDDAQVPPDDPRFSRRVKEIGHSIVSRLSVVDLASVVYTLDTRKSQEFTDDHAKLDAAIDRFAPGFRDNEFLYMLYAIETLGKLAERLVDIPQRRKTIFYVSVGVPIDIEVAATPALIGNASISDRGGQMGMLLQRAQDIFRFAQLSNVNIHCIDPSALYAGMGGEDRFRLHRDYLQTVSANTGGLAVVNREQFEPAIAQIFRENSSYYLIGYQSSHPAVDGKFRRLDVRVNQPGLTVRARSGYYAPRPESATKPTPQASPLVTALAGLLPKPDFPMQVSATPFAVPGKRDVAAIAIALGLLQDVASGATRTVEKVDLLVDAFTQDGRLKMAQSVKADVALRPNVSGKVGYEVLTRIDLPPGRYQLRLAAHLASQNRSGSIYYDVDVPDFSKDPLSMSGVVLNAAPGLAFAAQPTMMSLLPIMPTTQRFFVRTDLVKTYLRVYQGTRASIRPVVMAVRIADSTGAIISNSTQTMPQTTFTPDARAAGFEFPLPVATLAPGPYVVTFEGSTGATTVRRNVRFGIRQ